MSGYWYVGLAASTWGFWLLFLRPAGLPGGTSALVAMAVTALPAPFVLRRAALRDRVATACVALCGAADGMNVALYFAALRRGPVMIAVLTHYLAPLLVAVAAPWVLREPASRRVWLALPAALVGLGLVLGGPTDGEVLWTALLGTASAVLYATAVMASKRAATAYSPLAVTSLHSVVAVAALLLVFRGEALPATWDGSVLRVAAGGLVCGLAAGTMFNVGLRRIPAAAASVLTYLEPVTAVLLGALVFGEVLRPSAVIGAMVVLGTSLWVVSERRQGAA